jgi:hypothetical protein
LVICGYEVWWKDISSECGSWVTCQQLKILGVAKVSQRHGGRQLGLGTRPLMATDKSP